MCMCVCLRRVRTTRTRLQWGLTKFHRSKACQLFLQSHYKRVDVIGGRNATGDIWWNKDIGEVSSLVCNPDHDDAD